MKETTIIITTAITVQSENNIEQDEIVCSVKTALRVDNTKLLDSLTLMEEEQTDDELVSEHSLDSVCSTSQDEFNKTFNDILEGSTQRYLDSVSGEVSKKKTSRIEVLDKNGDWLIDYDPENQHFWYSYDRVYTIFMKQFSLQDVDRHRLMKSLVEKQYKMKGVTPVLPEKEDRQQGCETQYKMKDVTPIPHNELKGNRLSLSTK